MRALFEIDGASYAVESDAEGHVSVFPHESDRVAFRGWWMKGQGIDYVHDVESDWYHGRLPHHPGGQHVSLRRVASAASEAIHRARLLQLEGTRKNPAHRHRCACSRRVR